MNKITLTVLFFTAFTISALAQENLTLQQAIQTALNKNIDVIRAGNTMQAQQANLTSAYGNLLPSVNASAGWSRRGSSFDPTPLIPSGTSASGSTSVGISANVTLFDGLRNTANLSRAGNLASSSEYDFQKQKQTIVLAVQQAYLTVLRNHQLLKVAQDNLKQSQEQLARITESNKVGAVAKADLYRQQVQTANDELSVISAQSNYDNSQYDLLYLLALDVDKTYTFEDQDVLAQVENADSTYKNEIDDYQEMVKQALEIRPDYLSSKLAVDAAASSVSMARSGYFPSLSLNGGYGIGGTNFSDISDVKSWNVGISLSLPLFSGFQTKTSVQTSTLDYEYAQQNLQQAKRKVEKDIRTALLNLETAKKRLDVSAKNVISADEDRRIAEERYNLGSNTLLDLLVARANYTQAISNKVNSSYDFLYAKQQFRVAIGKDNF
ncbi:MAG: TolC family protein [Bacteroidetes bacterium]|nr:TolC family protein [Bacteroidota bacterium]